MTYKAIDNCQIMSLKIQVKRRLFNATSSSQGIAFKKIIIIF
jgi:hypothetical protein